MDHAPLRLIILGSTGSIGTQTIEVVRHLNALHARGLHPRRYDIVALAAGSRADALFHQAATLNITNLALASPQRPAHTPAAFNLRTGDHAAEALIHETPADFIISAIVGFAGLRATFAAATLGRTIALANKETLVAAGSLIAAAAQRSGAHLLPLDSEHSAIWQCLAARGAHAEPSHLRPIAPLPEDVAAITLTASGGPFLAWPADRIAAATPEDALNHPTWNMGAKVTIDCASLTNKALELIEAHHLFSAPAEKLSTLIHPQSIIHSFVEFRDGSIFAQLGDPDMRTPIQHALTFPLRVQGISRRASLAQLRSLTFEEPDPTRFPALAMGHTVITTGGTSGAIFNAANEQAVIAFLARRIPFPDIPRLAQRALRDLGSSPLTSIDDVFTADREARAWTTRQFR